MQCFKKTKNSSILRTMIRCLRQIEFIVNTCVTAPISIINTFVSYVVIEIKYYLICFPRELSRISAGMVM